MSEQRSNDLRPVVPGLFTLSHPDGRPRLSGGECPACGKHYFPRPRYCRSCLGPVQESELDGDGTVYSFTVVRVKPPLGLPAPYSVGYVDLEKSGLRVFGLLDPGAIGSLRIGLPVRLAVAPLGRDAVGEDCLRPYFTPRERG